MARAGEVAAGAIGAAALSIGCLLGAFTLIGGPVLVAHFDASIWWLLIPATFLALSNGRGITAYNMMWRKRTSEKLRTALYVVVLPIVLMFGLQWIVYKGAVFVMH